MKKHFNKAIGAVAVSCALASMSVTANQYNQDEQQAEQEALAGLDFFAQQQEKAAGLIITYTNQNASSMQKQALSSNSAMKTLSSRMGFKAKHKRFNFKNAQIVEFDRDHTVADLKRMAKELVKDNNIAKVEINKYVQAFATANDTHYGVQWHYTDPTAGINLESAWDTTQGEGVTVAVLDTGYRPHADLAANIVGGYDMISSSSIGNDGNGRDSNAQDPGDWTTGQCGPARNSSWHGTHVAGTIAAVTNNNTGVAGVAYKAKVVPVRVLGTCGGTTADIADAIVWAAGGSVSGVPANPNPAKVINMSLGGSGSCSSTTQSAINSARANGAVIVVASGNDNSNVTGYNPGNCNGVVSVAATNRQANRASYSNFGALIDIAAPGGEGGADGVASTMNSGTQGPTDDSYAYNAGTSMAAPHVAGVAALMFAVNPNLTPDEVEAKLKSSAKPFPSGSSCNTNNCGDGMLDAAAAVAAAQGGGNPPPPPAGNELSKGVSVSLAGATGSETRYTFEVPAGSSNLTFTMSGGSGDADLYTRFGSEPTTATYDFRPYKIGNAETCTVAAPQAGTYHVMVRGYAAFSGVSLVADYTDGSTPPPPPVNDTLSESNLSGARNSTQYFTLEVPAGRSTVNVNMSGGTGDADVYVRFGSQPTTGTYDCRPYKNGNNETCTLNAQAGTYHIMVRGYSAYSGVSLEGSSN